MKLRVVIVCVGCLA